LIYKIYLIDGDNGISILDASFKDFQAGKIDNNIITGFFKEINRIIDNIQIAMAKGEKKDELLRTIESENSTIVIFYHPPSRVLFCSISDADDNTDRLVDVIRKIASRFWKKHKADVELFRSTTEKSRFQTIITDIENLTHGGTIAEVFPRLLINVSVLKKIVSMGMINEIEFEIAIQCDGKTSPLDISRHFGKTQREIYESLTKLAQLDIIQI
jgi:hypothetical protein